MDTLDQLRAFVATAQSGSFTAGAETLGMSNRLTSKYVAELEQKLGTRLLQRTTRRVGLTPAGENLLARAPAILEEFDSLLGRIGEEAETLRGLIRISAPITIGETRIVDLLDRFTRRHPGIEIDLRLSDGFLDLAAEGIDLAFRIGTPGGQSHMLRKLATFRSRLVASPAYLDRAGRPMAPADLARHSCIIDTNRRNPRKWSFARDGRTIDVTVLGRFSVNSARASARLAVDGAGIAYVPDFVLDDPAARTGLETLLPDYGTTAGDISLVWLQGRSLPRKTRALIDFAVADFRRG